ncbi:MAG: phosphoribosylamine--glycine ligase [Pseudobdellovibrionaceae bacterium]
MKILLIGQGGREHALAWKLSQSSQCTHLFAAPGSAAIDREPKVTCLPFGGEAITDICAFCAAENIDLVVVGPEAPLVAGLADALRAQGVAVFGPSAAAARLEGSKGFMKDLCKKYDIPTAAYGRFTQKNAAMEFIRSQNLPIVIKADGLAAGKGVIIAQSLTEAEETLDDMLVGNAFGDAGSSVVVEQFLDGEEVSFFALSDGAHVVSFASAQDHKRAFDNDEGPNTGGMGAYSPARGGIWNEALEAEVMETIIQPTVAAMEAEGAPFNGVLYAGLMIMKGKPYLIEYNVRFGDPECQPMMMRLESDLVDLLKDAAEGNLARWDDKLRFSPQTALTVILAAKGYPGTYQKGTSIKGLEAIAGTSDTKIFHAGTIHEDAGWKSAGGRVLAVSALGENVKMAQRKAYALVEKIDWPDGFCRSDIGWRAAS